MTEENTINAPTWSEGGPVENMSGDQAQAEIKSIEKDPSFAGNGKLDYWSRQNMLKRRDSLYRHSMGEEGEKPYSGMEETLQKQGITKESLGAEQEKFKNRNETEEKKKTMDSLISHFGTEDDAKAAITEAKGLLHRFAKKEDFVFLDESGLGNDPELIGKLAEIAKIFKRANEEAREKDEK